MGDNCQLELRKLLPVWMDVYMYICMCVCMVITYSRGMDQPGMAANPARGQLNRENEYFPVRVRA